MAEYLWQLWREEREVELSRDGEDADVELADVSKPIREQTMAHAIASGVDEDKVLVVCGGAGQDTLNHCWNWIKLDNNMYTIDGVCSQQKIINNIFDRVIFDKNKYELAYSFGDTYGDVSCFDSYKPMMYMTPSTYHKLDNEIKE